MASIQKRGPRKDGTYSYQLQWRDRDTGLPERWTHETLAKAEEWKRLIEANGNSLARAERVVADSAMTGPTVTEAINSHIDQLVDITPYTRKRYKSAVRLHFSDALGAMKIRAVNHDHVIEWIKWMQGRSKGPKTISTQHGLLSAAMETAARRGILERNPCKGVRLPKKVRVGDDGDDIDMNDYQAIRDRADKHFRPFMDFLLGTGCRFSEATALTAKDFNLDAPVPLVFITKAHKLGGEENPARYVGEPKSAKSRRRVSLAPSTVAAIRANVEAAKDGGPVFRMKEGGVLDAQSFYNRAWEKPRREAGLGPGSNKHVTVHSIRHLHAAIMLHSGMSLYELSVRMGHTSIQITADLYAHLLPEAHFTGAQVAAKALGGMLVAEVKINDDVAS